MHDGNAGALDQSGQIGRLLMAARAGDHQGGAEGERPEEFPDRDVEAERRLLQDAVGRGEAVGVLHPGDAIDDAAMGVHDALGAAGGA